MDQRLIRHVRCPWIAWHSARWPLSSAFGQTAGEPPVRTPVCNRRGRLHRMFHHTAHTVQDKLVGYPDNFVEPPLGPLHQRTIRRAGRQG